MSTKAELDCSMLIDPKLLIGKYVRKTVTSYEHIHNKDGIVVHLEKSWQIDINFVHGISSVNIPTDCNMGEVSTYLILIGNHRYTYCNYKDHSRSHEWDKDIIFDKTVYEYSSDLENWISITKPVVCIDDSIPIT